MSFKAQNLKVDEHTQHNDPVSFIDKSDQRTPNYVFAQFVIKLLNSFVALYGKWLQSQLDQNAQDVVHVEQEHRSHVDQKVGRLEPDTLKVCVNWVGLLDLKIVVDDVGEVIKVKRSNRTDFFEKQSSVGGHRNLEERHHHNELLRVDH